MSGQQRQAGFTASVVIVPLLGAAGLVILLVPGLGGAWDGRLSALAWVALLAPVLYALVGAAQLPRRFAARRLRAALPDSIVEIAARGAAMSRDVAAINDALGTSYDTRWGSVCLSIDRSGLSIWPRSDSAAPEWKLSWNELSAPTVDVVTDSVLWTRSSFRGLEFSVLRDGRRFRLRVVLTGAGFAGIFPLSQADLNRVAEECARLRASAVDVQAQP